VRGVWRHRRLFGHRSSESREYPWDENAYILSGVYSEPSRRGHPERRRRDPALGRFAQADTLIPGAGNPLAWDRYAYGYDNPVRYTDPSGHFSEEQLKRWYGDNWKEVIAEKYSEIMAILLTQAEFGDLITYRLHGHVFGAVFVERESGGLAMWDVGAKRVTDVEKIDQYGLVGFYKRDSNSDRQYSLDTAFTQEAVESVELSIGWRCGDKNCVGSQIDISITKPSGWGWAGLVIGVAGLMIPGVPEYELLSNILAYGGLGVGIIDWVKIESHDKLMPYGPIPHNPVPGGPNTPQFLLPPMYGTPTPPVPLY